MILDLREFADFPANTTLEALPGEIKPYREDILEVQNVTIDIAIQKAGEEYFCQGKLTGRVRLECARCLAEYVLELEGVTDFIVCSDTQFNARRTGVIDDEDYVLLRGGDLLADITDIVIQTLVLATPMKPICSENCLGLCPDCGVNRNVESCDCNQDQIDDRWRGLTDFSRSS
jgi:uncharacterized protein